MNAAERSVKEKTVAFKYKPSEFMRGRRPEYYSDSKYDIESQLSKEVFEYHLDTLTSRKQEIEFEHFCRRLAEKEICPNLLPQSGPTGGGDSKVDSETYPVADELSARWYEGIGREASKERWAFAFSAKEDWRAKAQCDIEKVMQTGRGYKQAFFITNQFVKDSTRAVVESKLEKEHGIPVRILDRNWITKCVFENHRLDIAIETLKLEGYHSHSKMVLGPNDATRKSDLEELERDIGDPDKYKGLDYQLAEDCLRAAILARGLELPRIEVDGRFERASRIAEKLRIPQQQARIAYLEAWTAHWWYDDYVKLNRLYGEVEKLTIESDQSSELERLFNLWQVLNTAVQSGSLDGNIALITERTGKLEKALERLAADVARPTNALQAKALKVLMDIVRALRKPDELDHLLRQIHSIVIESVNLLAFPLDPIIKIVGELGDVFAESPQYDALLESVIKTAEERKRDGEAGRILLERGIQKFRVGKTYDSIRYFGRARHKLAKEEYQQGLIATLAGCTMAYEKAGLLWAARICVLAAINEIMASYIQDGKLEVRVLKYVMRMVWLELQVGRVPCVLAWMDMAHAVASQTLVDKQKREAYEKERRSQDIALGLLFLRMDVWNLKWLDFLPNVLEKRGLHTSWLSLLYALGYEEYLRSEGAIPDSESSASVQETLWEGVSGPGSEDLPEIGDLLLQRKLTFRSYVIGCELIIELDNEPVSIYLGETILGALEALLATSLQDFLPFRATFNIQINSSETAVGMPSAKIVEKEGTPVLVVRHPEDFSYGTIEERKLFGSWLMETVLLIAFHIGFAKDTRAHFEQSVRSEDLFSRAFDFSDLRILTENILGASPRYSMSDWESETVSERFPIRRDSAWSFGLVRPNQRVLDGKKKQSDPESSDIASRFGVDGMKHRDRRVFSLIENNLWDKAGWGATIYVYEEHQRMPPCLGIAFKNVEHGKLIFERWQKQIGKTDRSEQLRISIITGIDKKNPASYKVFIGSNFRTDDFEGIEWVTVSRIHKMEPRDTHNLDRFLKDLDKSKVYLLVPASDPRPSGKVQVFTKLGILKKELNIIQAWKLTLSDPEITVIGQDDDILVPDGVAKIPVHEALRQIKRVKGKRR